MSQGGGYYESQRPDPAPIAPVLPPYHWTSGFSRVSPSMRTDCADSTDPAAADRSTQGSSPHRGRQAGGSPQAHRGRKPCDSSARQTCSRSTDEPAQTGRRTQVGLERRPASFRSCHPCISGCNRLGLRHGLQPADSITRRMPQISYPISPSVGSPHLTERPTRSSCARVSSGTTARTLVRRMSSSPSSACSTPRRRPHTPQISVPESVSRR